MASIRRVVHRTGRMSWQARWRDPAGVQHSKNFPRRIDAERFLTTVEARKLAGTYIDPRAGRIRLGDFAEQATAGWVNRRDSTKARDESYLRSLVLPTFADMPIGAIGLFDVQDWVSDLDADGYAPATIRKAYQLLGRVLNDAAKGGLIAASPCQDVDLPKIENTEKRFLSPDEIVLLAGTIAPRYRALVVTAAYTGCRIGNSSLSTPTATSQTSGSCASNGLSLKFAATSGSGNPRPPLPAAPSPSPPGSPLSSTSTWPTTRPDPTGSSSPLPKAAPSGGTPSEPVSGSPSWPPRSASRCGSMISATATLRCSSPRAHTLP